MIVLPDAICGVVKTLRRTGSVADRIKAALSLVWDIVPP